MDPIGLSPISPEPARPPHDPTRPSPDAQEVAEEFSAVLLTFVVREMWKSASLDGQGLFGSAAGGEIHRGFVEGALASSLASGGFSGLTEAVARAIERSRTETLPEE
jgi:Rod binding domain-containing protein